MKRLVLLFAALLFVGCGEKNPAPDGGTEGADEGKADPVTGDPTPIGSSDAVGGLESQIIGYWAPDLEKIRKALETDLPEGVSEQLQVCFVQFAEGGKANFYRGPGRAPECIPS